MTSWNCHYPITYVITRRKKCPWGKKNFPCAAGMTLSWRRVILAQPGAARATKRIILESLYSVALQSASAAVSLAPKPGNSSFGKSDRVTSFQISTYYWKEVYLAINTRFLFITFSSLYYEGCCTMVNVSSKWMMILCKWTIIKWCLHCQMAPSKVKCVSGGVQCRMRGLFH